MRKIKLNTYSQLTKESSYAMGEGALPCVLALMKHVTRARPTDPPQPNHYSQTHKYSAQDKTKYNENKYRVTLKGIKNKFPNDRNNRNCIFSVTLCRP